MTSSPWWETDPTILEMKREAEEEVARWEREAAEKGHRITDEDEYDYQDEPEPEPDPVLEEIFSGRCVRALRRAKNNLDAATAAYEEAIRNARGAGLSWGEIGNLLGISRQALHRRFRERR